MSSPPSTARRHAIPQGLEGSDGHDSPGKEVTIASSSTFSPVPDAEGGDDAEDKACYICFDADVNVISLGCACRGAAGGAHVACMVLAAAQFERKTCGTSWAKCTLCYQKYGGKMRMRLAAEGVRRVQHLPETEPMWLFGHEILADALQDNCNHREAERLYRRVLLRQQAVFGVDHAKTLGTMHKLAGCLYSQSKLTESIMLCRTILRVQQEVFGHDEEHPNILGTKSSLASVLRRNGQIEEAESMFRATLKTMRAVLPENDVFILNTMNSFSGLLRDTKQYAEAEAMLRELNAVERQVFGPEHQRTLRSKRNLENTLARVPPV